MYISKNGGTLYSKEIHSNGKNLAKRDAYHNYNQNITGRHRVSKQVPTKDPLNKWHHSRDSHIRDLSACSINDEIVTNRYNSINKNNWGYYKK